MAKAKVEIPSHAQLIALAGKEWPELKAVLRIYYNEPDGSLVERGLEMLFMAYLAEKGALNGPENV